MSAGGTAASPGRTGHGLFAVDAGGSHTRVLVRLPGDGATRLPRLPSINPHATGEAADETLAELMADLRTALGDTPAVGWLASAAAATGRIEPELARVRSAAAAAGLAAELVVSNDVVPLLWGMPALAGTGVVVVCGTGSGFFGADGRERAAAAGGCEYLGSDEGGAADIAQHGLRAAVRATDGRGPATLLVDALAAAAGVGVTDLARQLAARPFPKQHLAELAPVVSACWLVGDEVAGSIVRQAVDDLVAGVRAVRDHLRLPEGFAVAAAGGVFSGCPQLYRELADRLAQHVGTSRVDLVTDPVSVALGALDRLRDGDRIALPSGIAGRYAASIRVDTPRRADVVGTVPGRVR